MDKGEEVRRRMGQLMGRPGMRANESVESSQGGSWPMGEWRRGLAEMSMRVRVGKRKPKLWGRTPERFELAMERKEREVEVTSSEGKERVTRPRHPRRVRSEFEGRGPEKALLEKSNVSTAVKRGKMFVTGPKRPEEERRIVLRRRHFGRIVGSSNGEQVASRARGGCAKNA
jgi:hypothetical protein